MNNLPPLPKWELALCFSVWIGHAVYAWYNVWIASYELENRLYSGFFAPGWRLLNGRRRDTSNYEWCSYFAFLPKELAIFILHTISMKIIDRKIRDKKKSEAAMITVWIGLLWIRLGWVGILTTFIHGGLMLTVSRLTRWKPAVWACACGLLTTLAGNYYPLGNDGDTHYRFAVYIAYKLLQFISFCVYDLDARKGKVKIDGGKKEKDDDDEKKKDENGELEVYCQSPIIAYYSMIKYALYPPYASTLIVLYSDFVSQWRHRPTITSDTKRIISIAIRVAFWSVFNDFILHFVYNNAMMLDPYLLAELDLMTMCAIGYTAGQYFYMKYVSIFGVNTIFALIDGMTPPAWPPICISRVALYSNMWRYFDRGLYSFLREQIFIPIASPTFSFVKRTLATFVCFAFVWLWHGLSWGFLYWVGFNFIEIMLENGAKQIYRYPRVNRLINSNLSPLNVRRLRACMHVVCTAWGIFSIFYFLGGADVGNLFVQRLVIDKGLRFKAPLFYLLALGYFYAQCCMEIEAYVN